MSSVLVDSNVLLDVLQQDPTWVGWSSGAIDAVSESARLVINPIIYAEVSVRYGKIEEVEAALPRTIFLREEIPYAAAFLAGKAFTTYRRRGGAGSAPLPDFFIGAHAAVAGHRLLTRDPRRYLTYFPTVDVIAPS